MTLEEAISFEDHFKDDIEFILNYSVDEFIEKLSLPCCPKLSKDDLLNLIDLMPLNHKYNPYARVLYKKISEQK